MTEKAQIKKDKKSAIDTVIIGLGVTGLSCARFLASCGLTFAVTDTRDNPPAMEQLLKENPDTLISTGDLDVELIMRAKQCLVSPGISIRDPAIQRAEQAGIEILGDIELFARHADAPVISITGANGKSTVTTLVYEMAQASGLEVRVGGNLGTPALNLISDSEPDLYVLELSSFQLETTHSLNSTAATVLNICADHMDRYSSVASYSEAKERIFEGDGEMILNADDPVVSGMSRSNRKVTFFTLNQPSKNEFGVREKDSESWLAFGSQNLMPVSEMKIQGQHNIANALAALALGKVAGLANEAMFEVLRNWPGLPHRCQWVAQQNGVDWYNDSKGTNEGSTVAAIKSFANRPIILIAGGDAKGATFEDLADASKGRVKTAILFGKDAEILQQQLENIIEVERADDVQQAVSRANRLVENGDIVLFSPACASLDMFQNYQQRGEVFTDAVNDCLLQGVRS